MARERFKLDSEERRPVGPRTGRSGRLGKALALALAALVANLPLTLDTVVWGPPASQSPPQPAVVSPPSVAQPALPTSTADSSRHAEQPRSPARLTATRPTWSHASAQEWPAPPDAQIYQTQPGDTLQVVALRFGVAPAGLRTWNALEIANQALLAPGEPLKIASQADPSGAQAWLLPDSELVYSPGAMEFDVTELVATWGGYLNEYRERVQGEWLHGPEVVLRAALDHSINPRLLLAILEMRGGWVGNPDMPRGLELTYPVWSGDGRLQGLYLQLSWAANELSHAYYGWRDGSYLEVPLADGSALPLAPDLNAATAAILHLSARFAAGGADPQAVAAQLLHVYTGLFGEPWQYGVPLFNAATVQPQLALPFPAENPWVFTGGPHGGWGTESAWAALDFAPKWDRRRRTSNKEVVALADGVVARLESGVLVLDLDGDGYEQTGWSILYLHVAPEEHIAVGTVLEQGELIGIASEVGGVSHGLHLHVARKYNGEWVAADGPLPFDLGGWRVRAGAETYLGVLHRQGIELLACPYASQTLLSVGGGEILSSPGLPDNLRGCWSKPGELEADPVSAGSPDRSIDPNFGSLSAEALELAPVDLPPTKLRAAPY